MRARTELAASLRSVVALAVILGVAGGVVLFSAAGARRTDTAYPRLLKWAHAPDTVVAGGGLFGFSRIDLARVARLPQVASSARISRFFFYPTTRSGRLLAVGVGAGSASARRSAGRLSSQPSLAVHLRPGADVRAFQRDVATVSSGGNPQIASILDTVPAMQRSIHPQAIAMWMFAALAALAGVLAFAQA